MYHVISERLKEALAIKKISLPQLAEKSGMSLNTLQNLYYAKVKNPNLETLKSICKSLDITMDYLVGLIKYDNQELEWIKLYQNCEKDYRNYLFELSKKHLECGRHGRGVSLNITRFEANYTKTLKERKNNMHSIICLVPDGHVEDGFEYKTCTTEFIDTVFENAYMAIKITTNNFIPSFINGDIIALENRYPREGEKAVYTKGSRAYFREYYCENGKIVLKTLNGKGEDFILNNLEGFDVLGTYINVIRWQ